jgi:hypothetical protein
MNEPEGFIVEFTPVPAWRTLASLCDNRLLGCVNVASGLGDAPVPLEA